MGGIGVTYTTKQSQLMVVPKLKTWARLDDCCEHFVPLIQINSTVTLAWMSKEAIHITDGWVGHYETDM